MKLQVLIMISVFTICTGGLSGVAAQRYDSVSYKGRLIYQNEFKNQERLKDWVMEGPGTFRIENGWMQLFSPGKKWDHVFWCPVEFPGSFIAEWEMQNLDTTEGLVIVFFAARGSNGKDIFDPSLPKRDGTFKYYNKGQINCYHISYYANNPKNPARVGSNLRKDPMFALLQEGAPGIPAQSLRIHKLRLIKQDRRVLLYVDDRKIIDYRDDTGTYGPPYQSGKIGFRQMRWSSFRYRNFKVWEIKNTKR